MKLWIFKKNKTNFREKYFFQKRNEKRSTWLPGNVGTAKVVSAISGFIPDWFHTAKIIIGQIEPIIDAQLAHINSPYAFSWSVA